MCGATPVAAIISSRRWYSSDVNLSSLAISSTMRRYSGVSGLVYRSSFSRSLSPSSLRMVRRAMRSYSDVEREKFRYLQPNMLGGQARRTCTSFAPLL